MITALYTGALEILLGFSSALKIVPKNGWRIMGLPVGETSWHISGTITNKTSPVGDDMNLGGGNPQFWSNFLFSVGV